MTRAENGYRAGFVAIVGRPNVGKSTLLNHLVRQKLSITSRRPQTTRHTLLGVHTRPDAQIVYVDTPGLHPDGEKAMNRYMNRSAAGVLNEVDAVVFVVEALNWTPQDEYVRDHLRSLAVPVFLVINKTDLIKPKDRLLPWINSVSERVNYRSVVPVSALRNQQLCELENEIVTVLPEGGHLYPEDQLTDRSERFLVAELIREKLTRTTGQEVPYELTVEIESFETSPELVRISAVIWVGRKGQKAIVIGKRGDNLKKIGRAAREDAEKLLNSKVYLQLWVKVKEGWSDDEKALRSLGYQE